MNGACVEFWNSHLTRILLRYLEKLTCASGTIFVKGNVEPYHVLTFRSWIRYWSTIRFYEANSNSLIWYQIIKYLINIDQLLIVHDKAQCKVNPKKILRCYLIALCEDSFSSIFLHSRNQTLSELFKLLLKTSGLISNLKFFWNIMSARYRAFFIHTYTLNCESECYWYRRSSHRTEKREHFFDKPSYENSK